MKEIKIRFRVLPDVNNGDAYHFYLTERNTSLNDIPLELYYEAINEANRFIDFYYLNMSYSERWSYLRRSNKQIPANYKFTKLQVNELITEKIINSKVFRLQILD